MSKVDDVKLFLEESKKHFAKNEKTEIRSPLGSIAYMKYKGNGNIMEYIIKMSHLASKLKTLKLELFEDLLVHLVLISLLTKYN